MNKKLLFWSIKAVSLCFGGFMLPVPATAHAPYWPTGLQCSMELADSLYRAHYQQQVKKQQEFSATIDFSRALVEWDYGWATDTGATKPAQQYARLGVSYNLVADTPEKNLAFVGARYAQSHAPTAEVRTFELVPDAHWREVVAGVKVSVWKILYVGGTVRYKFWLSVRDPKAAYLPGWGDYRPGDEETIGITCYLSVRIPFI